MKHLLNISKGLYVVPRLGQYICFYNTTRSPVQVGKLLSNISLIVVVQIHIGLHIVLHNASHWEYFSGFYAYNRYSSKKRPVKCQVDNALNCKNYSVVKLLDL